MTAPKPRDSLELARSISMRRKSNGEGDVESETAGVAASGRIGGMREHASATSTYDDARIKPAKRHDSTQLDDLEALPESTQLDDVEALPEGTQQEQQRAMIVPIYHSSSSTREYAGPDTVIMPSGNVVIPTVERQGSPSSERQAACSVQSTEPDTVPLAAQLAEPTSATATPIDQQPVLGTAQQPGGYGTMNASNTNTKSWLQRTSIPNDEDDGESVDTVVPTQALDEPRYRYVHVEGPPSDLESQVEEDYDCREGLIPSHDVIYKLLWRTILGWVLFLWLYLVFRPL